MKIHKKIVEHRKKLNFTQSDLANELGISRQAVSKWETEQSVPDIENILKLCKIFKVSINDLVETSNTNEEEFIIERDSTKTLGFSFLIVSLILTIIALQINIAYLIGTYIFLIVGFSMIVFRKNQILISLWILCLSSILILNPYWTSLPSIVSLIVNIKNGITFSMLLSILRILFLIILLILTITKKIKGKI